MRVRLDHADIGADFPDLAGALDAGLGVARSAGRVVVELRIDGGRVSDEQIKEMLRSGAAVGVIDLTSAEPRALVASTLLQAAGALEGLRSQQQAAGESIHGGKPDEAVESLTAIIATWQAVQRAVHDGAALVGLDPQRADVGVEGGLGAMGKELVAHLATLRDGLTSEDWSAVGDCLMYDLDEQARRWESALRRLAATVEGSTGGAGGGGGGGGGVGGGA